MLKTLVKISLVSLLFMTASSFAQGTGNTAKWTQSDYQKIANILSVYLGSDYIPKNAFDLSMMTEGAVKKFDNKIGQKIDQEDIDMLYGPDGNLGMVDYIRMLSSSTTPRPDALEISIRRILSYSLSDLASKISPGELMTKYLEVVSSQIEKEDIPVIIDDGLLEYIIDGVIRTKDRAIKATLLLDISGLIYKLDGAKLSASQKEILTLAKSLFLEQVKSFNVQKASDHLDYGAIRESLCDYLNIPLSYTSTVKELASKAISKLLMKEASILTDEELELFIGKGNLYYYLVNDAEGTPWASKDKYENIAKVSLLYDLINTRLTLDKEFPYENIETLNAEFSLFNRFYSPETYWKNLPEFYAQELEYKTLANEYKKTRNISEDNVEQKLTDIETLYNNESIKKADLRLSLEAYVGKKNLSDSKLLEAAFSVIYLNSALNKGVLSQAEIYNLMLAIDFGSIISISSDTPANMVNFVSKLKDVTNFECTASSYKSVENVNKLLQEFKDTKNVLKK
jgi:hypothetical protein